MSHRGSDPGQTQCRALEMKDGKDPVLAPRQLSSWEGEDSSWDACLRPAIRGNSGLQVSFLASDSLKRGVINRRK